MIYDPFSQTRNSSIPKCSIASFSLGAYLFMCVCLVGVHAQETSTANEARYTTLSNRMTGATFVGLFTIDGKSMKDTSPEKYEIKSFSKLPDDDKLWAIETRIAYGDHDVTVPFVLSIEWAGETPVIVMDRVFVPGLGTFSARVVLDEDKYAGTWAHVMKEGSVGGHLFGKIEPKTDNESK